MLSSNYNWTCPLCIEEINQPPFANASDINSSNGSRTEDEDEDLHDVWTEFDEMANKHQTNVKIGHINANSIAGFKFHEIKSWLLSGRLDILIVSETKLDSSFPSSQFHVDSFRMCRADRNIHGGGLMAFVRSDICFSVIRKFKTSAAKLSTFRTESMVLKVKINKSWMTIVGIYRPQAFLKANGKAK